MTPTLARCRSFTERVYLIVILILGQTVLQILTETGRDGLRLSYNSISKILLLQLVFKKHFKAIFDTVYSIWYENEHLINLKINSFYS